MGKKIQEAMDAEKPKFLSGAASREVEEKTAKETWDLLDKFANYGFNKSHAAAYAVLSYHCMKWHSFCLQIKPCNGIST